MIILIKDNITQYNTTVVVIYDNTLHPRFIPDPCDYSKGLGLAVLFHVFWYS